MVLFKKNVSVRSASDINSDNVLKPFRVGNVTDVLPDDQLKSILGGYDIDPENWDECCYCAWEAICGAYHSSSAGWVCGNEGDQDCRNGMGQLAQMFSEHYRDCKITLSCW